MNLKHRYGSELASRLYDTREKACVSGWESIKREYMGDAASRYFSRLSASGCEIYSEEGVFDVFELIVVVRGADDQGDSVESTVYKSFSSANGRQSFFIKNNVGGFDAFSNENSLSASSNGYFLLERNGTKKEFDTEGRLVSTESTGGHKKILQYDLSVAEGGDGNSETLDRISNHLGESLSLAYDANGNLITLTTPDGNIQYTYVSDLLDTVTYPDGKTRRYHYEDPSFPTHLTGITDENGDRYATWVYNSDGKVAESRHADGEGKVTFSYQGDHTVVNEFLDDGTSAQRTYTFELVKGVLKTKEITGDQCLTCNNGDMKSREYDANGFLSAYTDWNGNRTVMVNNQYGYPETITKAAGTSEQRITSIQYHNQWRSLPVLITEPERKTDLSYDAAGRLESRIVTDLTTGQSRTITRTYDANGLLDKVDDPRTDVNDIVDYDYDDQGNLLQITNALGHIVKTLEHDPSGRPKKIQDANGQLTLIDYYPRGWIKSINFAGAITQFEYDSVGQLTKTTLPNDVTLAHEYDAAHRLVKTTDGAGNHVVYEYDLMGNIRSQKVHDSSGSLRNSLELTYHNNGWLKEVIGATNQQTTTLVRDAMGNVTSHENPRKNSSDQVFDALNRLKQITDAEQGITRYEYDAQGNLVKVIAPNGAETIFEYNGFGERIMRTSPDSGETSYTYNSAGLVRTETDARGITITNAYDALNRVTSMTASDGQGISYYYDEGANGIGHLSRTVDNSGETRFEYDARGNRIAETRIQEGITTRIAYAYDVADQLETITYPSGHQVKYSRNDPTQH